MLLFELLRWWYGEGWIQWIKHTRQMVERVYRLFSVPILARTLFQPWKRIISYPGRSLAEQFRAWGDNLVSRFVGFSVRALSLVAAFLIIVGAGVVGAAGVVVWLALPVLIPIFVVLAVA